MTNLKALLWALAVSLCCFSYSNAQTSAPEGTDYIQDSVDFSFGSETWDPPDSVNELSIGDDERVGVPLDFGFPLGQRVYTYSWMHSNGVVSFLSTFNWMCCDGLDLENHNWASQTEPYFNHMIAPLWTDTINTNVDIDGDGIDDSGHYEESYEYTDGTKSQRYFWRNVAEYYNNNALNSFALEIYDDGQVDIWHFEIDIRNHDIFVGAVQDFVNDDDPVKGIIYHDKNTGDYTFTATDADDALIWSGKPFAIYPSECLTNSLYSTTCPGYAEALFQQQCDTDPLYDSSCPGYSTAYYNQQCSLNALYDPGCPGYQQAYYDQQCAADPLYDSGCPGYDTAYYNQQCSISALYDSGCDGYEQAYLDNQCSLDPLYSPSCSGYSAALAEQEATEEQVPEVVYVEEDYTEPQIIEDPVVNQVVFDEPEIEVIPEPEPEPYVSPVPELEIAAIIEEPIQEPTIEEQIEAEIEPQPEPEPAEEEITFTLFVEEPEEEEVVEEPIIEEEVDEETSETESSDNVDEQVDNSGDEESSDPQERDDGKAESSSEGRAKPKLSPSQKRAKVKKLLAKKAAELARDLASAATLEEQQRIQNEIFAIQTFNYEFKGYSVGLGYDQFTIPDAGVSPAASNQRGLRNGLAQELLHRQMVDMQWER